MAIEADDFENICRLHRRFEHAGWLCRNRTHMWCYLVAFGSIRCFPSFPSRSDTHTLREAEAQRGTSWRAFCFFESLGNSAEAEIVFWHLQAYRNFLRRYRLNSDSEIHMQLLCWPMRTYCVSGLFPGWENQKPEKNGWVKELRFGSRRHIEKAEDRVFTQVTSYVMILNTWIASVASDAHTASLISLENAHRFWGLSWRSIRCWAKRRKQCWQAIFLGRSSAHANKVAVFGTF
jgi:hypothetical protein